jgi:hypothetical protein
MNKSYISQENSIILLACSMETDIANSIASSIVREVGAVSRTVGLLTKPDRLVADSIGQWRRVLNGEHFPLGHGYYVTKQPSQAELVQASTHETARALENDFFQKSHTWKSEFADFANRFGTYCLQHSLSDKLAVLILTW